MTKFIEILMTGPPSGDAPQFVGIVDDQGEPVEVGVWYHDGEHWRYQIPVELVPRMVLTAEMLEGVARHVSSTPPLRDVVFRQDSISLSAGGGDDPKAQRRKLKEKVGAVKKDKQAVQPPPQDDWPPCPSCKKKFDPRKDEILACPQCGEDKSTFCCLTNPTQPCVDCDALNDTRSDFDKTASAGDGPFAQRVFDGQLTAKPGKDEDEDDES